MAEAASPKNATGRRRGPGRPFKKGEGGRKPGSRNKASLLAESMIAGDTEAIVKKLILRAKAGEPTCLRLCIERILPPCRSQPIQFEAGKVETASDAVQAMANIINLLAAGSLTPSEANDVCTVLGHFTKAVELVEIERRVADLERRAAQ